MGWIKRNLIFVIGGVVAVLLLAAGGYYAYSAYAHNAQSTGQISAIYTKLQQLQRQSPSPGNNKINNTATAREQTQKVRDWIKASDNYFSPVAPIPPGNVTSEAFASALRRTISQLKREADAGSVTLPADYDFSFAAQRPLVNFAPGSLEPLAGQLGEVRVIAKILFAARINSLVSIQRLRVSADDLNGPPADYMDGQAITNDLAVITPYVVTFRSFTPELAAVLCAFANSSNAFLVKAVNVQPAAGAASSGAAGMPGYGETGALPPGYGPGMLPPAALPGAYPPGMGPLPGAMAAQPATGRGGLPTVLKEQLLQFTMEVDFVKLLPKAGS